MALLSVKAARHAVGNAQYLCLFGTGVLVRECYDQLVNCLGREPDFFSDNARNKWGTELFGIKCISPEELSRLGGDTAVIITVRKYEDIFRQLRHMGIRNIMLASFDSCYYALHDLHLLDDGPWPASTPSPFNSGMKGKWVLVTGASRGVGRQIAIAMAELGANLIVQSRSIAHTQEVVRVCSERGVQVVPVSAELGKSAELAAMLSYLDQQTSQIDIVFNNAAISPPSQAGFWCVSDDVFRDCYAVNLIAPIRICQHLIPPMIDRGYGRIININSHLQGLPDEMPYACSKAALDKFVNELAPSLQNTGVMLSLIDPGWVRTDTGGAKAPHAVESVIPGLLLGAVMDADINGRRFSAQDYAGLSLGEAVQKAKMHLNRYGNRRWV